LNSQCNHFHPSNTPKKTPFVRERKPLLGKKMSHETAYPSRAILGFGPPRAAAADAALACVAILRHIETIE